MLRTRVLRFANFAFVVVLYTSSVAARAESAKNPKVEYVKCLVAIFEDISNDNALSDYQKRKMLMHVIVKEIDFEWSARAILGRYWKSASLEDRKSFVAAYKNNLMRTWLKKLTRISWSDNIVRVIERTRQINDLDDDVSCKLLLSSGKHSILTLRVRGGEDLNILNIAVNEVDLVSVYRSQFLSYIEESGLQALISHLSLNVNIKKK